MTDPAEHIETAAVTAGRPSGPGSPVNTPATFTSTYRFGGDVGYGRWGNPTWSAFEEALGRLEGGYAVAFSSGMGAVSALIDTLPLGSLVVAHDTAYSGTRSLLAQCAAHGTHRIRRVDMTDTEATIEALDGAELLWVETPTNPMLGIVDLSTVLGTANARGVTSVVDNTFATPVLQRPLEFGVTAVMHSATKYIGGHSDLLLGAVVTRDEAMRDQLLAHRTSRGAIPGTMEAWLALRGMRTLPLRMERAQSNALALATRLRAHPAVVAVSYPGLSDHPAAAIVTQQMDGPGAMVSFELADAQIADAFTAKLRIITDATSLGGVETTIDRRSRWDGDEGVPVGLMRLSVGIEHVDDLWADIAQALQT